MARQDRRSARIALVFAGVALLLTAGLTPGAAASLPKSFSRVAEGMFLPGASTLDGDQLVWASPQFSGDVDFMLTDLATGETSLLTSVVAPQGGIQILAVGFDGRWLAWLDDRFGNFEVFILDTGNGSLRRLTTTPADESGLAVAAGRAAWSSGGTLWLLDLRTMERTAHTPAGAQDGGACLSESLLAWSRLEGEISSLVAHDLASGRTWTVAQDPFIGQTNLHCDGSRVAWTSVQYIDPATMKPKAMRLVRWADLETGARGNVTTIDQRHGHIAGFASSHLAWVDYGAHGRVLRVHDLLSGAMLDLGDVQLAGLSAVAVVVAEGGDVGSWALYVQPWSPAPSSGLAKGIPGTPFGALALAVLAAAAGRLPADGRRAGPVGAS